MILTEKQFQDFFIFFKFEATKEYFSHKINRQGTDVRVVETST